MTTEKGTTTHSVEKIGGTSMSQYQAVRENIMLRPSHGGDSHYRRIFVVSAYGGITDMLLENKKTGVPGVYGLFANADDGDDWQLALNQLKDRIYAINAELFGDTDERIEADNFITERLDATERCLIDLHSICQHGHFALETHLQTVREMLASLGETHSAWNMAKLLRRDGINACFVDLTGWDADAALPLDEQIKTKLGDIDLQCELPIVTGYSHCSEGLMATFDRGYSEMTFSRIAVLTGASEAIIHKEYHLSSADPRLVGGDTAVPIGRTNYDVADQLANLGMEAIHPKAAKGLRQHNIPLRVKNTFEPEHTGTLITGDYRSESPCVEIIAGKRHVCSIEVFDQDMMGSIAEYDRNILEAVRQFKAQVITKDINANTITHYLDTSLKTIKRIKSKLEERYPEAEINVRKVSIVSAIGSDMQVPGLLAKTVKALSSVGISVLAVHQSMRQVDMQFVLDEQDYEEGMKSLHRDLIEVHDHGTAICAA